jgi:hypothetical protein
MHPYSAQGAPNPNTHRSRHREKVVEHLLIGEVLREMWCRNHTNVEVLKPEVDAAGYDIVLSYLKTMRHVLELPRSS